MATREFIVRLSSITAESSDGAGERLDRWLTVQLPEHSRNVVQRWIKEGNVLVNGSPARANLRLSTGDRVQVDMPETPTVTELSPEAIPLSILYEDSDILVINKPAGLVVHPAAGHASGTLVNAVLHHAPDLQGIGGELRPGIVHRLDKDTSGAIVVAKHESALRNLQAQFKSRKVSKQYIALVEGKVEQDSGKIVAPVGRDPNNRKRMAVITTEKTGTITARAAITEYKTLARYSIALQNDLGRGTFTLIEAHPITGRTHQIRIHFASIGHPLVGDPIYGLKRQRIRAPRLFLHAARLAFSLPSTGEWKEFFAPLPDELEELLNALRAASG